MSAKIIPFKSASTRTAVTAAPMTDDDIRAAIEQLEAIDHDLQLKAHAINISIGELRQQRLALLRQYEASRSA